MIEQIHHRNAFYAKAYRRLIGLNLFLFLMILLLSAWAISLYHTKAQAIYLPTTPEGKLIQDPPVNQAHLSDTEVITWAEKLLLMVYDFDYVNYRQSLQNLRTYFTPKGHGEYLAALDFSTNIEAVKNNKQVVSAEINGPAKIIQKGLNAGFYFWQIKIPLLIRYENAVGKLFLQRVTANLLVVRASTLTYPQGLSAHQLILEES